MSRVTASKVLRLTVYVLLVVSAGTVFFGGERLWHAARQGAVPSWAAMVPAFAFTLFVIIFTVDRLLLVKRRRYAMGRAFFQIALAVIFLSLLLPQEVSRLQESRGRPTPDTTLRLLRHRDPAVRASICELLAWRQETSSLAEITRLGETDPDADVRQACDSARLRLEQRSQDP